MALTISSSDFQNGGEIPQKFTCDGADISPELNWGSAPANTKSFALIADDPDAPAGTWTHWIIYNLPASATSLTQNVPKVDRLHEGGTQGRNSFRKIGYGGPCPPQGSPHRYFFKLYALSATLSLKPGASREELETAMQGRILAQAELMGRYQR